MTHRFRSPYERWLPLAAPIIGIGVAAWLVWMEGYRLNEPTVWGWALGGVGIGLLLRVWVAVSDPRRICRTCGVRASEIRSSCSKCGGTLAWHSVRPLFPAIQSTIPGLRKLSEGRTNWAALLVLLAVVGVMILSSIASPAGRGIGIAVAIGVALVVPALSRLQRNGIREIEDKLAASDGRLCTVCLYPRNDGSDRCPECGVRETEDELRALWERSGLWVSRSDRGDGTSP